MEASIRQAFEKWERGAAGDAPKVPAAAGTRFALLDRADAPQSTVMLGLRVPSPSHKDWVAFEVTDAILGGAFVSRITSNIREQKGYTYSPFSSIQTHPGEAHWVETADVTTKDTGAALKEIFFEIDRLRKKPRLPRSSAESRTTWPASSWCRTRRAAASSDGWRSSTCTGSATSISPTYVKRIMAVTPEDVRRIANDYLTPDKMTLVVVGDVKTVKEQVAPWSGR